MFLNQKRVFPNLNNKKFMNLADETEKKPFVSKVDRFKPTTNSISLGPGSYHFEQNLLNDSFNKKGYGNSFISESKRFTHAIKNSGPGPGTYELNNKIEKKEGKIHSSPGFIKHEMHNRFTKPDFKPGPTHYNIVFKNREVSSAKFVFNSNVDRLKGLAIKQITPGPGQYLAGQERKEEKKLMAVFVPSRKREKNLKNEILSEFNSIKPALEQNLSHVKYKENLLKSKKIRFKLSNEEMIKLSQLKGTKPNRIFNETNGVPGPGSYLKNDEIFKKNITGAVFKSESYRGEKKQEIREVGPGSYNSKLPGKKKDFHYNLKDSWI